jgi:hypothetical protein
MTTTTEAIWTQRDGTRIAVRDMGDRHLLSAIRWLQDCQARENGRKVIRGYAEGISDEERQRIYATEPTHAGYPAMADEARRRGLDVD